jgi:hypothetical protein
LREAICVDNVIDAYKMLVGDAEGCGRILVDFSLSGRIYTQTAR